MNKKLLLLAFAVAPFLLHAQDSQTRKVMIIGIDGTRSDALQQANTPNIDALIANGLYTFNAWHCGITVSAPSWSDMMCGVWEAKHGVTSNSYTGSNYNTYPYFPKRAKEILPNLYCVQVTEWAPMSDNVYNDGWDEKIKVPDGAGTPTAAAAVEELANPDLDCIFVYFDAVDLAGHANGFNPNNSSYMAAIEGVDVHIGTVLNALYARPNYSQENWLILLSTDHGGIGTGHGGGTDEERQIWWIASGAAVEHQEITGSDPGSYQYTGFPYFVGAVNPVVLKQTPVQTDIAVTALHHLLYDTGINPENQPAWAFDGKSWLSVFSSVDETKDNDIALYPNPAKGYVTVWFDNASNEKVSYSVFDISGKLITAESVFQNNNKLTLDMYGKDCGAYTINVLVGDKQFSKKFILQ